MVDLTFKEEPSKCLLVYSSKAIKMYSRDPEEESAAPLLQGKKDKKADKAGRKKRSRKCKDQAGQFAEEIEQNGN